jgi:DNA-binding NarL/FixJ family response regulator
MQRVRQSRSFVVNVLVAEANEMNCQLVEAAFRPRRTRVSVVARAVASSRALSLVKEVHPDIVVVSAELQDGPLEGFRVLRELRELQSRTRAIMLLGSRDPSVVIDAFRFGAHGVIFRDEPIETLGKCIHAVHAGQVWANSQHMGLLIDALYRATPLCLKDARGIDLLSKREEDVVRLVADGLSNKDVSVQLGLSEHTVRNYLFRVFDKIGVSSRVELVLYCLQARQKDLLNVRGDSRGKDGKQALIS